jgi:SAM-dependent methyltransferase
MNDLFSQATDPTQYDKLGNDWLVEGTTERPWRKLFKDSLGPIVGDLSNQSVLDIGCGTGWFSDFVFSLGAQSYLGLEPCKLSYKAAKSMHPTSKFINRPFEEFATYDRFDLITCLMSSEHIKDLKLAFSQWSQLLQPTGRVIIIAGDLQFFTTQRFNYSIITEWVSDQEAIVCTIRPDSVDTVDIIRAPAEYINAARLNGLNAYQIKPLKPTNKFIDQLPKYKDFRESAIYQLLVFTR